MPCSGAGLEALLVVGRTQLNGGDAAALDWLETQLGFTMTVVADSASQAADADGKALVVISSTSSSVAVGAKFTNVAVPVVTWETGVFDDLGMTAALAYAVPTGQTDVEIVDSEHPLAAGLAGALTVYTVAADMSAGVPESSATIVATLPGDSTQAVLFAYEPGDAMAGTITAPARRVGLPFRDFGPGQSTEDGERLGLVAFCWAAGLYP